MREEHCPSRAAAPVGVANEAVFRPYPIPLSTPCYKNLPFAAPVSPQLFVATAKFSSLRRVHRSIRDVVGPAARPLECRFTDP